MSLLLLLLACTEDDRSPLLFDGPVAAAVLDPAESIFDEPVGLVASSRSGEITPLDLKRGGYPAVSGASSFLRGPQIPTGEARLLGDIEVFGGGDPAAGGDGSVTAWVVDQTSQRLLEVPWITGVDADGDPVLPEPTLGEVRFEDADQSGDGVSVSGVRLRLGYTTTETFTFRYREGGWDVEGSRSGAQRLRASSGQPWWSDGGELGLVVTGEGTDGDVLTVATDTGIVEHDLGGRVLTLTRWGEVLLATVASTPPSLQLVVPETGAARTLATFEGGSAPSRVVGGPGDLIFVGDSAASLVHVYTVTRDDAGVPVSAADSPLSTTGPVVDLAWQAGTAQDGSSYSNLFVASLGALQVDVYDLLGGAWKAPNPLDPLRHGVFLGAPIAGLEPSVGEVWLQQETDWGARKKVATVAVVTSDGYLYQLEADTGCYVEDARGAHGPNPYVSSSEDSVGLADQGPHSSAILYVDPLGDQVAASDCGGVARDESWTFTFDSATQTWAVEGTLSGVQVGRAVSGRRYLSDNGAISVLIVDGALPPTDGDRFVLPIDDGLLAVAGLDTDRDQVPDKSYIAPSRPVAFETDNGPSGGGWDEVDLHQYVLLPVTNSDFVDRVWLDEAQTFTYWN